jgi:hypothetical protein
VHINALPHDLAHPTIGLRLSYQLNTCKIHAKYKQKR